MEMVKQVLPASLPVGQLQELAALRSRSLKNKITCSIAPAKSQPVAQKGIVKFRPCIDIHKVINFSFDSMRKQALNPEPFFLKSRISVPCLSFLQETME
jgi:hypothetical protein